MNKKYIQRCSLYLLGLIFIVSGMAKTFNIEGFAVEIAQFADYYLANWMVRWRTLCAILVCVAEVTVGCLAFRRKHALFVSAVMFVFLSFFLVLTGLNYFYPPAGGGVESCGCFGELIHFTPQSSFYKSLLLWGISIYPFIYSILSKQKSSIVALLFDKYAFGAIGLSLSASLLSLFLLHKTSVTLYSITYVFLLLTFFALLCICCRHEAKNKARL